MDWFPWGEEAFAKARDEEKPIFLSVGYSTCHWCHVMEHESFESAAIADFLKENFVSIKVDREERPDVDQVYMTFVQATTGHGGWPMSVWLTPELKPFVGGTYFPPVDMPGRPGFITVLRRIDELWKTERAPDSRTRPSPSSPALRDAEDRGPASAIIGRYVGRHQNLCNRGLTQYTRMFDAVEGGFGSAPKFPRPVNLEDFCFRPRRKNQDRMPMSPAAWPSTPCAKWPRAACTITSAAASTATPSMPNGTCLTSKKCSMIQAPVDASRT